MNDHRYTLEPYKGPSTRYRCPGCGQQRQFTRYIDKETGSHVADDVGKCNRENKCGYHKKPRDHFKEHPQTNVQWKYAAKQAPVFVAPPRPIDFLPVGLVDATRRNFDQNHLWQFFVRQIGEAATAALFEKYKVGTPRHWPGATAFWQLDFEGRPRQCKVMQYDPITGKRVKDGGRSFIAFMGKQIMGNPDANLQQCFFGEFILALFPLYPVAIVESEKTAMYCAHYFPNYVWLATGGKQGCRWTDKAVLAPLQGRTIVLFPDLKATADWKQKAAKVAATIRCKIFVSETLETQATEQERAEGLDLMDYHLKQSASCMPVPAMQQNEFSDTIKKGGIFPPDKKEVGNNSEKTEKQSRQANAKPTGCPDANPKRIFRPTWDLDAIRRDLAAVAIPDQPVRLSNCATVTNPQLFIDVSLQRIEANNGNPTFAPEYDRLMQFIAICKQAGPAVP